MLLTYKEPNTKILLHKTIEKYISACLLSIKVTHEVKNQCILAKMTSRIM